MTVHVYQQYFAAECVIGGVTRHGAAVQLTADSGNGQIRYTAAVYFFPHETAEDFGISYDAGAEKLLYDAKGRRSKKREAAMISDMQHTADALAGSLGGRIDWEAPLIAARYG